MAGYLRPVPENTPPTQKRFIAREVQDQVKRFRIMITARSQIVTSNPSDQSIAGKRNGKGSGKNGILIPEE
jgi:hypothetical protein